MLFQHDTPISRLLNISIEKGAIPSGRTVTGNPVSFDAQTAAPLKGLIIPFTASPGINGMNIYRTGKNLLNKANVINGYLYERGDGYKKIAGTSSARTVWMPCKPNTTYTCHKMTGGNRFMIMTSETTPVANLDEGLAYCQEKSGGTTSMKVVTTGANAKFLCLFVWINSADPDITAQDMVDSVMVELGDVTPTAYEPYNGTIIPVSWETEAGAVENGTFNAITGVLKATLPESKTVQLSPISISTLAGANVLWTDTNGVNTIKYT